MPVDECSRYNNEFPLSDDIIYLNHAAVSPWPQRTSNAIKQFADENLIYGASHYPQWVQKETSLRKQLKQLINAPSIDDIALLKNTSEALSVVAHGVQWNQCDEIIITDQEFPSNRIVWESLKDQQVNVIRANVSNTNDPEQAVLDTVTDKTRLISVSSVQYASGLKLDLEVIGKVCQEKDILFCVDAIQSLGAFRFDTQKINADFVMADGHKWLMAPEGIALFYSSKKVREQLKLHQFGWHMVEELGDFNNKNWKPASTARRFECGSPNMLGIHAMHASLELIHEVGLETIQQCVLDNTRFITEYINKSKNLALVSQYPASHHSGIVSFQHKTAENTPLFQYLTDNKVICAERGGGIRFSPHFYTPRGKIQQALQLAEEYPAN